MTTKTAAPAIPREVTRYVPDTIQAMLWGMAAGRCEFAGCNKRLYRSSVTQEQVNIGQKAHIYAFSADGPRGHKGIAKKKLNALGNLMLVCHGCHRKIDQAADGGRYTVTLLQEMKAAHECRIELVTGIATDKRSHVLLYGANIGEHGSLPNFLDASQALFPDRYPAEASPIALTTINSSFSERDADFWSREADNLRRLFERRVRERLSANEITHLSTFALAPQPLLILLGTLLGDIAVVDVYQRHREPATWTWPGTAMLPSFQIQEPASRGGPAALVLGVSATVTVDRITAVLGDKASVWTVTVPAPHNDVVKSKDQLAAFRSLMRPLLDRIKAAHGQEALLHVFPAAPVSVAVELGRIRMPKADMPWQVYDQVNERGFVPALTFSPGDSHAPHA